MQGEDDPNRPFDAAITASLKAPRPVKAAAAPCIDAELLAAWTDGTLPTADAASVEEHLSDCARCQAMLATLARTEPVPAAFASAKAWWHLRWLVPVATAATAVAVWVAIPENERSPLPSGVVKESDSASRPAAAAPETSAPAAAASPSVPSGRATPATTDSAPVSSGRADVESPSPSLEQESRGRASPGSDVLADGRVGREEAATGTRSVRGVADSPPAAQSGAAAPAPAERKEADANADRQLALLSATQARPFEVISPDPQSRWRVGVEGAIEHSSTGGVSWRPTTGVVPSRLNAGSSPTPHVCWFVGAAGLVVRTTTDVQLERLLFPAPVDLIAVRAINADAASVTSADGRTFRTADGGASWSVATP